MDLLLATFHPVAEWVDDQLYPVLSLFIILAALGTTALFLVSVIAYRRRRTFPYLIIMVAIGLLVFRTAIGFATMFGYVPMTLHHVIEHLTDFLIAALIIFLLYKVGPLGTKR